MTRLSEIQDHVASMDELRDIVGAMRSLAGMRMQESVHALEGIRAYAQSMLGAIGHALLLLARQEAPARGGAGRRLLVLCTAEHGFVGGFNERMLDAAEAMLGADDLLFVLGSRGAALAAERGRAVAWTRPMPTRLAGAPQTVDRLTDELYARLARGELARIDVVFGRYRQGTAPAVERRRLLPLDLAALAAPPARQAPLHNLPPRELLEKLVAEYVFALLTEAAIESIASENAARFAAMSAAHDNVGKKLAKLQEEERLARQTEITAELLDLLTGAQAMQEAAKPTLAG